MADMQSGTGSGLIAFLEYAEQRGLLKATTARAYRSAVVKILEIDDENIDVLSLDLDEHFDRFQRLSGHNYTPGSLGTYRARFRSAVDMYSQYLRDPKNFKPPMRQRQSDKKVAPVNGNRSDVRDPEPMRVQQRIEAPANRDLYSHRFPLRSGDDAYLYLPRNLTTEDVERMTTFLKSLAIDPPAQLPSGLNDE
jgi:hypothetical protein